MKRILATIICAAAAVSCADKPGTGNTPPEGYIKVYEYRPAPGQFINDPASGFGSVASDAAAARFAEARLNAPGGGQFVSLGAFGGYIVAGFDLSVANSGGYDFSVSGNQFATSSEPGVVWVMADANANGLPDDRWYELRGSESGKEGTIRGYAVTYFRPDGGSRDVRWEDDRGGSGVVPANDFHKQAYYPVWIAADSYRLEGTMIPSAKYQMEGGAWSNGEYGWGYADNWGSDRVDPQNPSKVFFKISNAVDGSGEQADLPSIDFIKVQCAVIDNNGSLGEFSTEVTGFSIENLE